MNLHQRWTQTDLNDLRRRLKDGTSCAEIATTLGRAPDAVRAMMKRLRLREIESATAREY